MTGGMLAVLGLRSSMSALAGAEVSISPLGLANMPPQLSEEKERAL